MLRPGHRLYPRVLVVAVATVVTVAYGALLYGFSVLVTADAAGAVFSSTTLSLAFSGAVLTGGAASLVVGRVVDRHGVRLIMGLGSLLGCAGLLGFAAAQEPWQVLAAWWVVVGPASAMVLYEPAFVVIDQWFDGGRRNKAVATLTFLAGLAGPIFIPFTGWLVTQFGWRTATVVLGLLLASVGGATALLVIRPAPSVLARRTEPPAPPISVRRLLSSPRFVRFTAGLCLSLLVFEALLVHRIARFEEAGFTLATIAFWAAIAGVLSFPGRLALPMLASRLSGTRLYAAVLAGVVAALGFAVGGGSRVELVGHFVLFGLVFGAAIPLRVIVMSDWYSGGGFGRLMGVQAAAIAVSRSIGPAITGVVRDASGSYQPAMVLLVVLTLVATALVVFAERAPDPLVAAAQPGAGAETRSPTTP